MPRQKKKNTPVNLFCDSLHFNFQLKNKKCIDEPGDGKVTLCWAQQTVRT